MSDITAAPIPPDGRLQAWRNFGGVLQTRWKDTSDPNSQWTAPWAPFITTGLGGAVAPFVDMTAGNLSDGRTQIWAVDSAGVVWTTWKVSTAHDALWTSWSKFNTANITAGTVHSIAVAELPDDRLQLFIMDNTNKTWTAWKTTTDPSSAWTAFSAF